MKRQKDGSVNGNADNYVIRYSYTITVPSDISKLFSNIKFKIFFISIESPLGPY